MSARRQGPRPWKRGGLHKLACHDCRTYAYATVAQIERHGLLAASMELAAIDDMRRERWEACRSNRLQALKPAPTPIPF
jgi:hypothetical protein